MHQPEEHHCVQIHLVDVADPEAPPCWPGIAAVSDADHLDIYCPAQIGRDARQVCVDLIVAYCLGPLARTA
ncbi:MAG TPA: hypothetical protein VGG83_10670 [Trebonia sp.]|jgi:hypothetical protein